MSKYKTNEVPDYIKENFETDFLPCPRCGSEYVTWTNSRDLDILTQYVYCEGCSLDTFAVDTTCFIGLENKDYETTLMKYNTWVKTKPTRYHEEDWSE